MRSQLRTWTWPLRRVIAGFLVIGGSASLASAFSVGSSTTLRRSSFVPYSFVSQDLRFKRRKLIVSSRRSPIYDRNIGDESAGSLGKFDPLNFASSEEEEWMKYERSGRHNSAKASGDRVAALTTAATSAALVLVHPSVSEAASKFSTGDFDPESFKPVCATSDGFYRFLQGATNAVVGDDNFVQYGPLIAEGLLRIRLELCVVESFFNEAVGPFIKQNGLSWILPLHETVETFLSGTIFALATTFILVGSTKLISVIVTYGDFLVGGPCRLLGTFAFDRARGKPVTLDLGIGPWKKRVIGPPKDADGWTGIDEEKIVDFDNVSPTQIPLILVSGAVKVAGESSKIVREIVDTFDIFVGRYLVLLAGGYIGLKFLHFKVFPDFPPF